MTLNVLPWVIGGVAALAFTAWALVSLAAVLR